MVFEPPAGLAPVLHLDHVRIRQVLLNLLANACRFTPEGEIKVELLPGGDEVVLGVSDTGPGIPAEQLETIFEEFRQGTSPELDELRSAGKGLGLAIARHFVQMHGGRIWVESRSDPANGQTGSSFYFSLPLAEKQVVQLAPPPSADQHSGGLPSIVVVDDGEGQRLLARHLDGYEVLAAADLAEAHKLVRQSHPQAVIINVPPEAQDATQARPPAILSEPVPVLQCSLPVGRWFMEPELFDDWLVKPVDIGRLAEAVGRCPGLRRVLVVDDDRAFVRLIRRALEARFPDCEIVSARDSEEAQARLAQEPVQVALLDIGLPGADGRSLARALRDRDSALTVIAVTGIQPGLEGQASTPHGFSVTSSRGFGEEETLALIRACLGLLQPSYALEEPLPAPQAALAAR
jgi:CheY-like chemotaxis protein